MGGGGVTGVVDRETVLYNVKVLFVKHFICIKSWIHLFIVNKLLKVFFIFWHLWKEEMQYLYWSKIPGRVGANTSTCTLLQEIQMSATAELHSCSSFVCQYCPILPYLHASVMVGIYQNYYVHCASGISL